LKERLALLECGVEPVPAPKARAGGQRKTVVRLARRGALLATSFWVGLASGSALGGAMLLLAFLTHPEDMRMRLQHIQAATDALAGPAVRAPREAESHAAADAATPSAFEMHLDRGEGGLASLGLRVLGVDGSDGVRILLHDVPATAELSRGERRDRSTWSLRVAELENLQLRLGDGTPDTFDMMIEVATAGGTRMASAVAHVRVSEPSRAAKMPSPAVPAATARIDGVWQPAVSAISDVVDIERPFSTEVAAPAKTDPASAEQRSKRPLLPQGISALGGPTGDPGSDAPQPNEGRTVWWKLPPPGWSPFTDAPGSH
jgi:hypothetical protein